METKYSGVRESRPNHFLDYGAVNGQVLEEFDKKCIKHADRTFAQCRQCQEISSMFAMITMQDAVFISHAPLGCTGCTTYSADLYRSAQMMRGATVIENPRIIATNFDQHNVILGGADKLREAIRKAEDRYHPKLIVIFCSCASGVIGEDIEGVVDEMQPSVNARIMPIHCEGFKSKMCSSGYDASFLSVSKYILDDVKPEREEGLINLFAPTSVSAQDQKEMERMLGQIGLHANYIPYFANLDNIRKIPNASASTSICRVFADEFMKQLSKDYDIPFSHTVMPIGILNTDRWYRGIAKITGKEDEVEEIIEKEHARIQPEIDKIKEVLEGKKAFLCGGVGRTFAAASLISDYGMKLVGMETPTLNDDTFEDLQYISSLHDGFIVDIAQMQPYEQVNLVKKLKPDLFFGWPTWTARLGIPTTHILDFKKPTMGYDGIVNLGKKIVDQYKNPGFNKKIGKYSPLPYRDSWYDEDPFKYIVAKGGNK